VSPERRLLDMALDAAGLADDLESLSAKLAASGVGVEGGGPVGWPERLAIMGREVEELSMALKAEMEAAGRREAG
jgi:hypothetical protein